MEQQQHHNEDQREVVERERRQRFLMARHAEERLRELGRPHRASNLVQQETLIETRTGFDPCLSDLNMRPHYRDCMEGNLEAHVNGLRFLSGRRRAVDLIYNNIKYAVFQPCHLDETMVLIHFHLRNPITIENKDEKDIQFYTKAVDEYKSPLFNNDMDRNRERRLRESKEQQNAAFKEFCKRVEAIARANGNDLEFDLPYRDLGFFGTPHNDMVFLQPTLNCLVNLTETPFFLVDLENVDHVHFERITFSSNDFDMVLIHKDFTKQPWRIDRIPIEEKDSILVWLTDMEITYTQGPLSLNWTAILRAVASDERFYMRTEQDGVTQKQAGWEFLRPDDNGDDDRDDVEMDEDEDDSNYEEGVDEGAEDEISVVSQLDQVAEPEERAVSGGEYNAFMQRHLDMLLEVVENMDATVGRR